MDEHTGDAITPESQGGTAADGAAFDAAPDAAVDATVDEADEAGMALLRSGVPLSLLIDLADPEGPASEELFSHETVPDSVWYRMPRLTGTTDRSDRTGPGAG